MSKPWEGRFSKATRTSVENFTESLSYDYRLYPYDIRASMAHATMLGETGLIKKTETCKIISGRMGKLGARNLGQIRDH